MHAPAGCCKERKVRQGSRSLVQTALKLLSILVLVRPTAPILEPHQVLERLMASVSMCLAAAGILPLGQAAPRCGCSGVAATQDP